ncbi:hypothetical protein [Bellilinea sp.]|uniref:hypothetical protein n=1 Tax=Bellilinea sp. TaxID=2838785 RepID=UPI002ADD7DAD|nr:hypothetical protein [Bellilinea sp.]
MASVTNALSQNQIEPVRIPLLFIFLPRIDLIIGVALMITGLVLPSLMVLGLISVNLWLGLLSFGLIAIGGILFTVFIGEIR